MTVTEAIHPFLLLASVALDGLLLPAPQAVYLFLRKLSLQDSRGDSGPAAGRYQWRNTKWQLWENTDADTETGETGAMAWQQTYRPPRLGSYVGWLVQTSGYDWGLPDDEVSWSGDLIKRQSLGKVRISRSFLPKLTRWLKFRGSGPIFSRKHIESAYLGYFFHHFWRYFRFLLRSLPLTYHLIHPKQVGQGE